MTKLLKDFTPEDFQKYTPEQLEAIIKKEYQETIMKPHTAHSFVTEGSKTRDGGIVKINSNIERGKSMLGGRAKALVGDFVEYPDGTTSTIISGTGQARVLCNIPFAITGSVLENGDVITETAVEGAVILKFDDEAIEGFLVPHWKAA